MAYKAVTRIKHGRGAEGSLVFEAGEIVTGLPTATMKELWTAGALEKVEEAAPEPPVVDEGQTSEEPPPTGDENPADDNGDNTDPPDGGSGENKE
jgi:hypothetical protein